MEQADFALRAATCGIVLFTGAILWRDAPRARSTWLFGFLALSVVAYSLFGASGPAQWSRPFRGLFLFFAYPAGFLFWAFTRSVFEDDFVPRPSHWALLAGTIALAGIWLIFPRDSVEMHYWVVGVPLRIVPLLFIGDALRRLWNDRRFDLVESRARMRVVLFYAAGLTAMVKILVTFHYGPATHWLDAARVLDALATTATITAGGFAFLQLQTDLRPAPSNAGPAGSIPPGDVDALLLPRLQSLMSAEAAWRKAGLTIGDLAGKLGIPEYRLRRLLNQKLGFRNFSAFLNGYRLEAAAKALADPAQRHLPVLTIALDLGWGSIGPFNRAFRARYGMTPTEYRKGLAEN